MDRQEELHHHGSITKQTVVTTDPSGRQTRVSVKIASYDNVFIRSECKNTSKKPPREASPSLIGRGFLGGVSAHVTPVLGRRSDAVNEGRLSQQCTPVMRRREILDSPGGSPLLARRADDEAEEGYEVDHSVIRGWLKFRDNKRWKTRWGVVTKLSPVADCLHLQLYRDPKDLYKNGQAKASLSLQHFIGFESGFTLEKESHTMAIICQDVTVVLAFEKREKLITWQIKVGSQLGSSKQFLVMISGANKKLVSGPASLHLQGQRFALTSGVPPRLLGLWELAHLRRYGVVEGRFCFEGGSSCGKGEGLHIFITDQAKDITAAFDAASQIYVCMQRTPSASRKSTDKGNKTQPSTQMYLNTVNTSIPDLPASTLHEENCEEDFRQLCCSLDKRGGRGPWNDADHVTLERCNNCLIKLGVMDQSSTVDLNTGTNFNPAWIMEAVPESCSSKSPNSSEYLTPRGIQKSFEACQPDKLANRPPKPPTAKIMSRRKVSGPLPKEFLNINDNKPGSNSKVGPYENYDVPKTAHNEFQVDSSEHYDTPKRLKPTLSEDLFQVTKSSAPGNLVLKKKCGCILKFASNKKPVIVECEENIQPVDCPCHKVTNWANNFISIPYCKQTATSISTNVHTDEKLQDMAIYATVDVSKKTNRQSSVTDKDSSHESQFSVYQNLCHETKDNTKFEGLYANYENLEFALFLENYEKAKDLLKKAGVTQTELDALSANLDIAAPTLPENSKVCMQCGHSQIQSIPDDSKRSKSDEYLIMEPSCKGIQEICKTFGSSPGYTPMSPNPNWSQTLKYPLQKVNQVEVEMSLSISALNVSESNPVYFTKNNIKEALHKRSSSVDFAELHEGPKEFDSNIGSHAISSLSERFKNIASNNRRPSSPYHYETKCADCYKSSSSDNKTSESSLKDITNNRNKLIDNDQINRSSIVPCKSGGNRDSSSSNDSGVSSLSLKHGGREFNEFEMPLTSGHSKYHDMMHKKMKDNLSGRANPYLSRKAKSSDPLRSMSIQIHKASLRAKSSSAGAEVPVLPPKPIKGVIDTHSTSSGTSDMSDYIETLSMTSSQSSSDAPSGVRTGHQPTTTLRPRSGKEYHKVDPSMYKNGKDPANYTNIP